MPSLYSGAPDFAFSLIDRIDVSGLVGRGAPTRVMLDVAMLSTATGVPGSRTSISAVLPPGATEAEVRRHLYATLRAYIAAHAEPLPREPQSRAKRRELDRREGETRGFREHIDDDYGDDDIDEGDDDDVDSYGPVAVYAIRY